MGCTTRPHWRPSMPCPSRCRSSEPPQTGSPLPLLGEYWGDARPSTEECVYAADLDGTCALSLSVFLCSSLRASACVELRVTTSSRNQCHLVVLRNRNDNHAFTLSQKRRQCTWSCLMKPTLVELRGRYIVHAKPQPTAHLHRRPPLNRPASTQARAH